MFLRAAIVWATAVLAPPLAAQDATRHASISIGVPDAPVQVALVATASCEGCHGLFDMLLDPSLLRGARVSPVVAALEDGRLRVVRRSWIAEETVLVADLLARCSTAPGETMRRLSSAPDAWFTFLHPATGAPFPMTWADFGAILGHVPTPDRLTPDLPASCPRDAETGQEVMCHFRAFVGEYGQIEPPPAHVDGTPVLGADAIREALPAAVEVDPQQDALDRMGYHLAAMRDAQAIIDGDSDHVPRTGTRPLRIPGAE